MLNLNRETNRAEKRGKTKNSAELGRSSYAKAMEDKGEKTEMKKPVQMVRNAAGIYVANKLGERFVQRTRRKAGGTLVKAAVIGVALYAGVAITGAVFGAAIGATWWALTLPFSHPILTGIVGLGTYLWFKTRNLLR